MIVTLTPNPSLDRTLRVDRLRRGAVLRASAVTVEPSGKGVNVSRALAANGLDTLAVFPVAGNDGTRLTDLLEAAALRFVAVPVNSPVRSNVTLLEPDGTATKVNEPGPELSAEEIAELIDTSLRVTPQGAWIVGCGSLPRGAPDGFYAELVERAHERGASVAVDSSGAALDVAVRAGADLVKPNREELTAAVGRPLGTLGDVVEAAAELQARGARTVLASLGADGAMLVDGAVCHGEVAVPEIRTTVGAGDALLAGFLAGGAGGRDALVTGLTWAAACCRRTGPEMPTVSTDGQRAVVLHDGVDLDRPLHQGAEEMANRGRSS